LSRGNGSALRCKDAGIRRPSFLAVIALSLAAVVAFTGDALAKAQTLTDTVPQSDFADFITAEGAPLTGPDPYTFGNEVQACESIDSITVTLTLFDGDTGRGPFDTDRNDLTLGLDGIDTGIALNGFPDSETVTNTLTGVPKHMTQILAALKEDGQLVGSVIDRKPDDNFVGIPATFDTTLEITCGAAAAGQAPAPAPAPITQETEQFAENSDVAQDVQVTNVHQK
jgi:hypothetical protein